MRDQGLRRLLSLAVTPLTLMALLVGVVMLGSLGDAVVNQVVVTAIINLIVVVGIYVFIGNSGVFSFGHIGFMAIGAYVAALLRMPVDTKQTFLTAAPHFVITQHISTVPSIVIGGGAAALVAAVLAIPITRLSGLTAGLATFAMLNVIYVVAKNEEALTNGVRGLGPVPITTTRDSALIWALAAIAVAYVFQESSVGLRLRASREDEIGARAVGIKVARERGIAFVISAFFVGIAGGLYGQYLGSFTPDAFFLQLTFLTITMLVVGGITSLSGAVIGAIVVSTVAELLRHIELGVHVGPVFIQAPSGLEEVGIAVLIIAILVLRPDGLTAGRELPWALRGLVLPVGVRRFSSQRPQSESPAPAGSDLAARHTDSPTHKLGADDD